MFNIGGAELLVIMLAALVILGPQRLPNAARQIGKTMGDLRRLSTGFQNEVRGALDLTGEQASRTPARSVLAPGAPTPETPEPVAAELDTAGATAGAVTAVSHRTPAAASTNGTRVAKPSTAKPSTAKPSTAKPSTAKRSTATTPAVRARRPVGKASAPKAAAKARASKPPAATSGKPPIKSTAKTTTARATSGGRTVATKKKSASAVPEPTRRRNGS